MGFFTHHQQLHLFYVAALFMVTFQLVTRLTEYTFMFHQGILLLSSALIGAGLAMMGAMLLPPRWREWCVARLPLFLLVNFLLYVLLFFATQSLVGHFLVLASLFGTFFLLITQMIHLQPDHFTAIELSGSFVGVVGLVWLSQYVLEEWLLVGVLLAMVGYIVATVAWYRIRGVLGLTALLGTAFMIYTLTTHTLPALITCPDQAQTYKIACVETSDTFQLVDSIPNVKGRSDVFLNTGPAIPRLSVYNSGLHTGTSLVREEYAVQPNTHNDVEIPPLAYQGGSRVMAAGASTGSNVLTFQKYIEDPNVIAVEIDTIITDLYRSPVYHDFLPIEDSFDFVFKDARTYFDMSDAEYDVISMMVESVNTTLQPYIDESTSLVYTTEAMQTYLDALAPDGYLLLQQFHSPGPFGEAMIHKVLGTLEAALDPAAARTMKDNILLYSYATSPDAWAQRFLIAVYKPVGFTEADLQNYHKWETALQNQQKTIGDTGVLTTLHTPGGDVQYNSFFTASTRAKLAAQYNTSIITDDKPFRHLVTTLPFPAEYYILIGGVVLVMLILVVLASHTTATTAVPLLGMAAGLGVVTFGLQYVLYYKTAAFLGTSLIFFSVFLLVPLLFGAIGGYLSHRLTYMRALILTGASLGSAVVLVSGSAFALPPSIVFVLIAIIFVFSGTLFPLLLARTHIAASRSTMYAMNMCGGGVAAIVMISLHAIVGWTYLFGGLMLVMTLLFIVLYRSFVRV